MIRRVSRPAAVVGLVGAVCIPLAATAQAQRQPAPERRPPATTQPAVPTTEPDAASPEPAVPTAEDIIEAFERDRPRNTPIRPTETLSAPPAERVGEAPSRRLARFPDGHPLVDRVGRIVRDGEWWAFAFESDTKSAPEPPMKLLPNRMLEQAVFAIEGTPNAVFVVSGEVTDFQGRNYLLLRKLLRQRDHGNLRK